LISDCERLISSFSDEVLTQFVGGPELFIFGENEFSQVMEDSEELQPYDACLDCERLCGSRNGARLESFEILIILC